MRAIHQHAPPDVAKNKNENEREDESDEEFGPVHGRGLTTAGNFVELKAVPTPGLERDRNQ